MEEEYLIKLPLTDADFMDNSLSFSIEHMKSRLTSTVYFIVDFYNMSNELIHTYKATRWVVDSTYSSYHTNFDIPSSIADESSKFQLTLVACNITSENPLWLTGLMFREGDYDGYHVPSEETNDALIKLNKSSYANLYNRDGTYLQVIRPSRTIFHANKLDKCASTILVPHIPDESDIDDPVAVFLEFINMTDQRIDVLR